MADCSQSRYSFTEIFDYLAHGKYPMNVDKQYKHGLRKRSKFFCEQRGQLYYIGGQKDKKKPCLVIENESESFPMCEDPFVQILYVPGEEHWIAVSGVSESEACVYDSVFSTTLDSTKMQIATIMHTSETYSGEDPVSSRCSGLWSLCHCICY